MCGQLTEQVLDLEIAKWKEHGVTVIDVYVALGRIWPEFKATDAEVDRANDIYSNDDIEIDDAALTSPSPDRDGKWVAAWVWLSDAG